MPGTLFPSLLCVAVLSAPTPPAAAVVRYTLAAAKAVPPLAEQAVSGSKMMAPGAPFAAGVKMPPVFAPATPDVAQPLPPGAGVIFVAGGLGGGDSLAVHSRRALERCCLPHEVCSYQWCHGKGHRFQDLFDHCNVVCHSDGLAQQIMDYKAQNPGRPVYVMAWSAGVGVALGAAEKLPPDSIERIIVMCAACSRCYNLCGALRATRCGIVSFHSPMDHFFLNALMRCLGTIDRVHGLGAGVYGFSPPACLCPEEHMLYAKLIQIPWRPHMMLDGHPGGHLWYKSDRFLCAHVIPWLQTCPPAYVPATTPTQPTPEQLPAPHQQISINDPEEPMPVSNVPAALASQTR